METIRAAERAEAAYERKMYRYKAQYSLDTYYFQAALPVKYSVLCFSYFMDTNTISYYNWLCYNKPNKVISKRINIIMHKSDSFENLAVRSTLNNILVLPASLSHNLGFRYRPHDQVVTVHLLLIRCLRTFSCPNSLHYFLCHIYKKVCCINIRIKFPKVNFLHYVPPFRFTGD